VYYYEHNTKYLSKAPSFGIVCQHVETIDEKWSFSGKAGISQGCILIYSEARHFTLLAI